MDLCELRANADAAGLRARHLMGSGTMASCCKGFRWRLRHTETWNRVCGIQFEDWIYTGELSTLPTSVEARSGRAWRLQEPACKDKDYTIRMG